LIREPVELDELVRDLLAELPEAQRMRVSISQPCDVEGSWDRDRVKQALLTLVSNALQHSTPDAAVHVRVSVDAGTESTREVGIEVENEGQIAQEVLESLFIPKRHAAHPAAASGLGLGLYVAEHVAAAHGGVLEVSSAQGRTRFALRLPAQPAHVAKPAKVTTKHA
jgi:signal transduction histidine kinase